MKNQVEKLLDEAISNGYKTFEIYPIVTSGRGRYLEILADNSEKYISAFKVLGLSYTESHFEDKSGAVLKKFVVTVKTKTKKVAEE